MAQATVLVEPLPKASGSLFGIKPTELFFFDRLYEDGQKLHAWRSPRCSLLSEVPE